MHLAMVVLIAAASAAACGLDVVGSGPSVGSSDAGDGAQQSIEDGSTSNDDAGATEVDGATIDAGSDACIPSPSGLVSWWTGDGDLNDHQGANDGVSGIQKGATPVTFGAGYRGQAFDLQGKSYVQVPNTASLQLTAGGTIEALVSSSSFGGRIVDKITAGGADGYMLDTYQSKLRLIAGNVVVSSPATLPVNTWVHVAGTWDGSFARVYVNGIEVASAQAPSLPSNTLALRLGADSTGASRFAGAIDEVALYSRALSAAEVGAVAASGLTGRCK